MSHVVVVQNRGFMVGGSCPFLEAECREPPSGFQVASGWSFERHGSVRIRCVEGGDVLMTGAKTLELELALKRIPTRRVGDFLSIQVIAGQDIELSSGLSVLANKVDVISTQTGILWCVATCMGRLGQLKQTAHSLVSQKCCRYILVDWSCPDKCGDWVESNFPQATVVRVPNQKGFMGGAARNAGAALVPDGEWICFIDCDVVAHSTFCDRMLFRRAPNALIWPSNGDFGTYGTIMVNKSDFEKAGRYDDVFRSWGHEDVDLMNRMAHIGVKIARQGLRPLLRHIHHDDALRTQYSAIANKHKSNYANQLYCQVRNAKTYKLKRPLTLQERVTIYDSILTSTGELK